MSHYWTTKEKDIRIANDILEKYADKRHTETLSLFELVVIEKEKRMDFRLADWVRVLALQFNDMYGVTQGEFVTRQVISHYIVREETIH